jgi:hypothetical protein
MSGTPLQRVGGSSHRAASSGNQKPAMPVAPALVSSNGVAEVLTNKGPQRSFDSHRKDHQIGWGSQSTTSRTRVGRGNLLANSMTGRRNAACSSSRSKSDFGGVSGKRVALRFRISKQHRESYRARLDKLAPLSPPGNRCPVSLAMRQALKIETRCIDSSTLAHGLATWTLGSSSAYRACHASKPSVSLPCPIL